MKTMFCPADGTLCKPSNETSGQTNMECANGHSFSIKYDETKDRIINTNLETIPYSHLPETGNLFDSSRVGSTR